MMKRYYTGLGGLPGTYFSNNTITGSTASTISASTQLKGYPGSVVVVKVTTYNHSNGGAVYQLNGTTHVLNDTVSLTLDAHGQVVFTQFLNVGTGVPGNAIQVQLTIISTSLGFIAFPATNQNSLTT